MPTFSAIALDRFLEPGASNSNNNDISDPSPKLERRNTTPFPTDDLKSSTNRFNIPPPHPQLRRRNSVAFAVVSENKTPSRPHMSPALYATPESTPLPDSPISSFSPSSPYIINHKRRGPRLLKSSSEQKVAVVAVEKKDADNGHSRSFSDKEERLFDEMVNGSFPVDVEVEFKGLNGDVTAQEGEINGFNGDVVGQNGDQKFVFGLRSERGGRDIEDFFDPQESLSFTSNSDGNDSSVGRSARANTPIGEFFDAWEELSCDSGREAQHSLADVESELREMRLSLLMEIEQRKQAEEAVNSMHSQWQTLRDKLGTVGLSLPVDLSASLEDSQSNIDPTEEICQQIHLARFVSESIGRGIAKAEVEAEMEAQLEMKNFEIARVCDRLHYYETMNREMSQRNQEAIEIARHERQKRRRRQKWVWASIGAAITLGSAALALSYLPSGKGSSSTDSLEAPESERNVQ